MSKGFLSGLDAIVSRFNLRITSKVLSGIAALQGVVTSLLHSLSRSPKLHAGPQKASHAQRILAILAGSAIAIIIIVAAFSGPLMAFLELYSPYDRFGIKRLYAANVEGPHWDSRSWLTFERKLMSTQVDPQDPYFQVRGASNTLSIRGDGTAESSGDVVRYYISDPEEKKEWKNFEFTMYSMRMSEVNPPSYAGFAVQGRTGPGHTENAGTNSKGYPIQCDGSSYSAAIRYNGSIDFKKEIHWPTYTKENPLRILYPDGVPKNQWIGMKYVVYNVNGGQDVKMELWIDETDGKAGGDWRKVMEYVDSGGWAISSDEPAALCGYSADEKLLAGGAAIIIRNDGVETQLYKNISIREIAVTPTMDAA